MKFLSGVQVKKPKKVKSKQMRQQSVFVVRINNGTLLTYHHLERKCGRLQRKVVWIYIRRGVSDTLESVSIKTNNGIGCNFMSFYGGQME